MSVKNILGADGKISSQYLPVSGGGSIGPDIVCSTLVVNYPGEVGPNPRMEGILLYSDAGLAPLNIQAFTQASISLLGQQANIFCQTNDNQFPSEITTTCQIDLELGSANKVTLSPNDTLFGAPTSRIEQIGYLSTIGQGGGVVFTQQLVKADDSDNCGTHWTTEFSGAFQNIPTSVWTILDSNASAVNRISLQANNIFLGSASNDVTIGTGNFIIENGNINITSGDINTTAGTVNANIGSFITSLTVAGNPIGGTSQTTYNNAGAITTGPGPDAAAYLKFPAVTGVDTFTTVVGGVYCIQGLLEIISDENAGSPFAVTVGIKNGGGTDNIILVDETSASFVAGGAKSGVPFFVNGTFVAQDIEARVFIVNSAVADGGATSDASMIKPSFIRIR